MKTHSRTKQVAAGFTLIEVMITVAVIAIIAAVALPNYFDYITRSRIVEAKTNLADMRTRMEQFFLDNRTYPATCVASTAAPGATEIRLPGNAKFFGYTCGNLSATSYTITATGAAGMAGFGYTVNEANTRTTTGTGAWGKTSPTCWVSKKSGEC